MKTHELKTTPEYFEQSWNLNKRFELRLNDRDFQKGDQVILLEYNPDDDKYTGRRIWSTISYVLKDYKGLDKDYCILQLSNFDSYYVR